MSCADTPSERLNDPTQFEDPLSDYEPKEYASEVERTIAESPVTEIIPRPCVTLSPTAPIRDAVQTMYGSGTAILLIVDEGRLLGVLTQRDVLEQVSECFDSLAHRPVSEVMTSNPTVVYETDTVGTAIAAVAIAGHRHVPVLDVNDNLLGVLSPQRIFAFLDQLFHPDAKCKL